jgi:dihydroorotate dehydrogenase
MGDAAVEDFATSYRTLSPLADFVVLNVSCPNTAEGKTFEEPATLGALLFAISHEREATKAADPPPVLVKLSAPPNAGTEAGREQLRTIVETATASGIVSGFVVSNTIPTAQAEGNVRLSPEGRGTKDAVGRGGLSGRPICDRSTKTIREVYSLTGGKMPIIGVGGVDTAETAYTKIRAGASLIEVYTGMVYQGPGLFSDIHVGLRRLLKRDGFTSITEAVGVDVKM